MYGIIGYIGSKPAQPILLAGLARMEYRGYDSAGVAILNGTSLYVERAKGKVAVLKQKIEDAIARGCDVDQPRNLAKSVTVE